MLSLKRVEIVKVALVVVLLSFFNKSVCILTWHQFLCFIHECWPFSNMIIFFQGIAASTVIIFTAPEYDSLSKSEFAKIPKIHKREIQFCFLSFTGCLWYKIRLLFFFCCEPIQLCLLHLMWQDAAKIWGRYNSQWAPTSVVLLSFFILCIFKWLPLELGRGFSPLFPSYLLI